MADQSSTLYETMVAAERRQLATQLGMRVADLEEQQALALALAASEKDSAQVPAQTSAQATPAPATSQEQEQEQKQEQKQEEEEGIEVMGTFARSDNQLDPSTRLTEEQKSRSKWWLLPQELADRILLFVGSIDMLGYVQLIAKTNPFRPSEYAWRQMAKQTYPRQFGAATRLIIENWGGSWRNLVIHRPRLRTNGFYTLRTLYTKAAQNDDPDADRIVGSLETVHHRHFRFFHDGKVLYCSTPLLDPWKMETRLGEARTIDKLIILGSYKIKGRAVTCSFELHYCTIVFDMEVLDGCESYSMYPGKHSVLRILRHSQATPGRGVKDECELPLPINSDCRFWRVWTYNPSQPIA